MAIAREAGSLTAARAGEARLRLRISVMLALSIGLLVTLAVLSVLVIQFRVTRANTFDLLNEKAGFILSTVEKDIASHLNPVREQIEFIAAQIEGGYYSLSDKERLLPLLTGALAPLPQVDRVVVVDTSLQLVGVRRGADGAIAVIAEDLTREPENLERRNKLHESAGMIWGDLIYKHGKTFITLQRALRRDGKVIGYLASGISTTELSQLADETSALLSTSLDNGSESFLATAFVLYGPNKVLGHPNLISDSSLQSAENPAVSIGQVGDIVLGSLWEGETVPGFERAAADDVNVVSIELGSEESDLEYVAIYKWLNNYGEVPWGIGMWAEAADLDDEIERLATSALGGLAVALIAMIAAILVGRLLAKPIQAVSTNALKIGDFDLKDIEVLPPSRIKELDDEAAAFNTMLTGLRLFETYVPRALVAKLMRAEGAVVSENRKVTVMFTDIVGYTATSENQSASEVATFLNHHFTELGACVEAESGTIDKFIGDSLMAFWGAPEHQEHTERRACRAAVAIAKAVSVENERRMTNGLALVRLRVGIHTGDVVVGNIGSPGRINYTIVGDTVNSCQRIEALGKEVAPEAEIVVLLSQETADGLDGEFALKRVGEFEVKGRKEEIEVFQLLV